MIPSVHAHPRLLLVSAGLLLGGCATTPPGALTLDPEKNAAAFGERSLRDAGLHRFLADNLGRDPGNRWDFEALAWAAFYFHPSLDLARAQWATAQATAGTAAQRPNPTLTLTPGYNFTREAGLSPWMPAVGLDFLMPTTEKRKLQQAIAGFDGEAARLGVFTSVWQVRSEVRRAYFDLSLARRRQGALQAQADAQHALLKLLQDRFAAGSIAAPELSTVRSATLRADAALADAQTQLLTATAKLAAALGLPASALEGVEFPAPPSAIVLGADELQAARTKALQGRADVLAALAKFRSVQAALELEAAKRTPDFHLGPGYQWDQGANKWTLALAFEIPLFHRNEAGVAEAVARRNEAAAQFNVVQAQAIAAIDLAVAAQRAAQAQVASSGHLRTEAEQQRARAQQRFELGGADQVEVQTAALDLAAAELAIVEAEGATTTAAGQLEDALQIPFPNLAAATQSPRK